MRWPAMRLSEAKRPQTNGQSHGERRTLRRPPAYPKLHCHRAIQFFGWRPDHPVSSDGKRHRTLRLACGRSHRPRHKVLCTSAAEAVKLLVTQPSRRFQTTEGSPIAIPSHQATQPGIPKPLARNSSPIQPTYRTERHAFAVGDLPSGCEAGAAVAGDTGRTSTLSTRWRSISRTSKT